MEKLVADLQKILPFKETTEVGDIVLLVAKEPQMLLYALVTDIERDSSRKDEWWHVRMQILSVPPQSVTWTLRLEQFTGREIFTMGGEQRFVQAVHLDTARVDSPTPQSLNTKNGLRLVK